MKILKFDLSSGLVVYLVALPLCLGIALASGAPLASGIVSGIIGGIIVGALSGSQTSVSGPAAGLATIVLGSITRLGSFEIFSYAVMIAGLIQVLMGFCKAGIMAKYVPSNVIKGLLASIGILLILKQIPHALGYDVHHEDTFSFAQPNGENTFTHFFGTVSHVHMGSLIISLLSLFFLVFWDRLKFGTLKFLPSAVVVVFTGIGINELFFRLGSPLYLNAEHLVEIPAIGISELFSFRLPTFESLSNPLIWMTALTLATVASLETLLNLEAVDEIDPHKRESPPNRELIAQGFGNFLAGLVGGLPITSVIVRSSVNINAGARSKLSTIIHGVFLLGSILLIAPFINRIPLATLAMILIVTGLKLAKPTLFLSMLKKGPHQWIPFFATIIGILMTDLLIGVVIGLAMAFFFILKGNLKNPFSLEKEFLYNDETIRIEFPGQVSFLNKATIKTTLWSIPEGAKVIIDASKADFIDEDVLEILEDFTSVIVPERDIKLNLIGIKKNYVLNEQVQFINVLDKKTQLELTPALILSFLKQGNDRFINGKWSKKEFLHQVNATSMGQNPMVVILSCIDSRTAPEIIFDSNLGDIISMRIAGNVVNEDIIGSIELSCSKIGTKLIVVLGHSNCGAIAAAHNYVGDGKIIHLTNKIRPALDLAAASFKGLGEQELLEKACVINVQNSLEEIKRGSPYIREKLEEGSLGIISAYYDTVSGRVEFRV